MKEPKTFKYPRLYWRDSSTDWNTRVRIIYPNGTSVWGDGQSIKGECWQKSAPCWTQLMPYWYDGEEAVRRMKIFDKNLGFETHFLGEIK